jgi:hypothetical protein
MRSPPLHPHHGAASVADITCEEGEYPMNSWHLRDLTAATGAPPGDGQVAGYVFAAQGTQHIVYRHGATASIHELWWDADGWHHNDLTAAAGAPRSLNDGPAGYVFDAQGTQHVLYTGFDLHVHELWWDADGWHHNDLTADTGAPLVGSRPVGYAFNAQGTQHVIYQSDSDGHVQELWWDINGWHHNDLTVVTGAVSAGSEPVGYVFEAQGTQHVIYQGYDDGGYIHELWWDTDGWHHNNLSAATGAPMCLSDPAAYMFAAQGTQHVVYVAGEDAYHIQGLHELWWDTHGWHHNDLNAAAGAPPPAGDDPFGYVFAAQGTQHVVYPGQENPNHIHELWWDTNGWHHNDLTAAAGAPPVDGLVGNTLAGYAFDAQDTQHVVYIGGLVGPNGPDENPVYELWWGCAVPDETASGRLLQRETVGQLTEESERY